MPTLARRTGATVVLAAVIAAGAWRLATSADASSSGWPSAPDDLLAVPAAVTDAGGGSTAFMAEFDGRPVRHDPCAPIHVVINGRTAPPGSDDLLAEAIAEVSAASGLTFVLDGFTEEAPSTERQYRTDDGWAPLLVAWTDPDEVSGLAGDVVGRGGSTTVERDGTPWLVGGILVLDGPQIGERISARVAGDDARAAARAVIMHELGHVLGLDHVDDPNEIMNAHGSVTRWGPGDLSGLARVGAGPCVDY